MMHNYTLSVTRESDDEFIAFPFSFEATICQPASEVWREVVRGMVDHASGWMWPTQYSQPIVTPVPPRRGARLVLTYQIPNPKKPGGPKKDATYEFDIIDYSDEERFYEYRATPKHPFLRGGGRVSVSPVDALSSRLTWKGRYQHIAGHAGKEAQGDVFAYFLCMFFTALAQNIKDRVGYEAAAGA